MSNLRPLVYDSQKYNALMEYLTDKIENKKSSLVGQVDSVQIYRLQGEIMALRGLLTLREEVLKDG